jgi:polysaccharide export outer membrane protein
MLMLLLLLSLQAIPADAPDRSLYAVGPNDVLTVTVFNQPQLSGKFPVESDGTVAVPLLGRVTVAGLKIRAIEDLLRKRLVAGGYLNEPHLSVNIEQFRSQQIFVMGEVREPGSLQFTGSMTLLEALARVGSTTERAGPEVVIVRPPAAGSSTPSTQSNGNHGKAETIRINLEDLQTGILSQNLALRPGDTIFVPRAQSVFVSGQVRTPGQYVIRAGMTVRQVLALAGGLTDRGSTRRIDIVRQVDGKEVEYDGDLDTPVAPGDTIVVGERFF